MLLSRLLDALQVGITAVFGKELDDVDTLLPVELQSIGSPIVDVVLRDDLSVSFDTRIHARMYSPR